MKNIWMLLAVGLSVTLIGCDSPEPSVEDASSQGSSSDHDHDHDGHDDDHEGHGHDDAEHDHDEDEHGAPGSLGEAVKQIKTMGGKVTTAFADGTPDDAHDELHEIGHAIESLPGLASKSSMTDEQQETVRLATESLMDAFGELDGTLHGGDEVDLDEISKKVSTHIEKLEALL
ncbi:MAG: hypothetical protein AAFV88_00175 [Planctomycetota bacterium]